MIHMHAPSIDGFKVPAEKKHTHMIDMIHTIHACMRAYMHAHISHTYMCIHAYVQGLRQYLDWKIKPDDFSSPTLARLGMSFAPGDTHTDRNDKHTRTDGQTDRHTRTCTRTRARAHTHTHARTHTQASS